MRLGRDVGKKPKIENQNVDIKFLSNNFISLVKAFMGKCKYCGPFRANPKHLRKEHFIPIPECELENILEKWRDLKKSWRKNGREEILFNSKIFIDKYISMIVVHLTEKKRITLKNRYA